MDDFEKQFQPFQERMAAENIPGLVIKTFRYYFQQLVEGNTGFIRESEIQPISSLPDMDTLGGKSDLVGDKALTKTVLIKLNGGLGTSMGLEKAKALLKVKDGLSFLDIIARQALHDQLPLILMNSFSTSKDSLSTLQAYPELHGHLPLEFLQHRIPKIQKSGMVPAIWPDAPLLEWCPPGHGDIYPAMITSGLLEMMLDNGYKYAFISNADNLGAVIDKSILGYFVGRDLPFMMEVAERTPIDRKGGHLAQHPNGQMLLREAAQCHPDDEDEFQDIQKHRYFNTNSIWISLPALKSLLHEMDNLLELPMIRNQKTLDPRDPNSPPVYQLETALGSAIKCFFGSSALKVPRSRFAPVKTTNDLFGIQSDCYQLNADTRIEVAPSRKQGPPIISLDSRYYKLIDQMDERIPYGPPSMVNCDQLTVEGDILFGRNIQLIGKVSLVNQTNKQAQLPDGSKIEGVWTA